LPSGASSVTEPPAQNVAGPLAMTVGAGGGAVTVMTAEPVALLPEQFASAMVAVYVRVDAGETTRSANDAVIPLCVTPSDQITVNGATPVRSVRMVADPVPQYAADPLTTPVGRGSTVTTTGSEVFEHPEAFVMVTEYVPDCVTVMFAVVAPLDQRYVPAPCDVPRVTLLPAQNVVAP
jgi:hypothetical protein